MRARLAELGLAVPGRSPPVRRPGGRRAVRRRARLAGGAQGGPRRLRRARRVDARRARRRSWSPSCWRPGTPLMVEQAVPMRRELAALVARSPFGQAAAWPVVETVQADGQCVAGARPGAGPGRGRRGRGPAAGAADRRRAGRDRAAGGRAVRDATAGGLVVNELAMRPHNSGHWTIEGARTSQFEQHLRAVLDYPLGATEPTAPAVVMANVLGAAEAAGDAHRRAGAPPVRPVPGRARCTCTARRERPARKVGHVTVLGDDVDDGARRGRRWPRLAVHGRWADGWSAHAATVEAAGA